MTSIFLITDRNQSRGVQLKNGALHGVAASKGFNEPPLEGIEIEHHARAAFVRLDEILNEVGMSRENVKFVQVYLHDVLRDVDGFNLVWRDYFEDLSPARCCVGAVLQAGMLVEMTFIADSD